MSSQSATRIRATYTKMLPQLLFAKEQYPNNYQTPPL
jgi:hypothetical protein